MSGCATQMTFVMQVHTEDFVTRFSSGSLTEAEMRRIGFGEVTRHADLIERTKAEVAGTPPAVKVHHPKEPSCMYNTT